jgi:integrase
MRFIIEGNDSEIIAFLARMQDEGLSLSGGSLEDCIMRQTTQPSIGFTSNDLARKQATQRVTMAQAIQAFTDQLMLDDRATLHQKRMLAYLKEVSLRFVWSGPHDIVVENVRDALVDAQRQGNGPRTRNAKRSYLSTFCTFCVENGWIAFNPVLKMRRARELRRRARIIPTEDQVRQLIITAQSDYRKKYRWLMYLAAASSGLRWGTLKVLEWEWVHEAAFPPHFDIPAHALKGREPRVVWMSQELGETFARVRAQLGNPTGRVFLTAPKNEHFRRDLKAAGIPIGNELGIKGAPTFSFHSLRHFASNRMKWAEAFTDNERAAQNGHASVQITTGVYTDVEHVEIGKKIYRMKNIMENGVNVTTPPPKTRRVVPKEFDSKEKPADSHSASSSKFPMCNTPHKSEEAARQTNGEMGILPAGACIETRARQGGEPLLRSCSGPTDKSRFSGAITPQNGVCAEASQPPNHGEDALESALRIAELALSQCRYLLAQRRIDETRKGQHVDVHG